MLISAFEIIVVTESEHRSANIYTKRSLSVQSYALWDNIPGTSAVLNQKPIQLQRREILYRFPLLLQVDCFRGQEIPILKSHKNNAGDEQGRLKPGFMGLKPNLELDLEILYKHYFVYLHPAGLQPAKAWPFLSAPTLD